MKKLSIFFSISLYVIALNSIGLQDNSSPFEELIRAISICDSKKVENILKNNNPNGFINFKDDRGETPLIKVSIKLNQSNCTKDCKEVARLLLKYGANVNATNSGGDNSPLYAISSAKPSCIDIIDLFLRHGADVNFRSNFDRSPLTSAVIIGNKEIVSLLLATGADFKLNLKYYKNFRDPLLLAIAEATRYRHKEIESLLRTIYKLNIGELNLKDIQDQETKDIIIKRWINTGDIKSPKYFHSWINEKLKSNKDKKELLSGVYLNSLIKLFENYPYGGYVRKLLDFYKEIASPEEKLKIEKLTDMDKFDKRFSDIDVKTVS